MIETAQVIWDDYFKHYEERRKTFALFSGTTCSPNPTFYQSGLYDLLEAAKTDFEVCSAIQHVLWTVEREVPYKLDDCCSRLQGVFELSPTIMARLARHGGTATLFPSGARLLDQDVVEKNLVWLARYPHARQPTVRRRADVTCCTEKREKSGEAER